MGVTDQGDIIVGVGCGDRDVREPNTTIAPDNAFQRELQTSYGAHDANVARVHSGWQDKFRQIRATIAQQSATSVGERIGHLGHGRTAGIVTVIVRPPSLRGLADALPLWTVEMDLTIARPSP